MKFGTKLFVALLICGVVSQAQAIVTLQIASREAIDGTSLERLILQMDTDGLPISGIDLVITSPAGTMHQETIGANSPQFQDQAASNDDLLISVGADPRFLDNDTYWLFNSGDVQTTVSGPRNPPYEIYPQNGWGTTTTLDENLDYFTGVFSVDTGVVVGLAGPQTLVVDDVGPFTSRAVAQIVVQQGTTLTLQFGQASDVEANPFETANVIAVGDGIENVPEPAGLCVGLMSLGLLAARRRRRSA
ncbi:hypothetical protein HED60_21705 [Planctomycetales bacterium ZRK34]|nr:hypothetical protein HED60_21705 [Planctomycetales bacterium ZRK34]